jgi:tRNA threonylcarbamoyladenosine biosynthesis protein TsaB
MLLAIDTSTQLAGLALYDGAVQAELVWVAGRRHSAQVMPQLERLLRLLDMEVTALTAVAAARGPGSFTGVRVGLAAAQGLALALDLPVYGVCSLDVLAAGQQTTELPVRPMLDAGRQRFATALYERHDGCLQRQGDIVGIELSQLEKLVKAPCLICGDLDEASRGRVREMLGQRAVIASPAVSLRRPAVLAELAWKQHGAGVDGGASSLEPFYLSR